MAMVTMFDGQVREKDTFTKSLPLPILAIAWTSPSCTESSSELTLSSSSDKAVPESESLYGN